MATRSTAAEALAGGEAYPLAPDEYSSAGLTHCEVKVLQASHGRNVIPSSADSLWWRTVCDVLAEPMFLLLLGAAGLYSVLGDTPEAPTLLAFVVAVVLLTIFQSHRTASVLRALRDLSAPRTQVLREGKREYVAAAELVPGDIVFVEEGAKVPADGRVTEAHELKHGAGIAHDLFSCSCKKTLRSRAEWKQRAGVLRHRHKSDLCTIGKQGSCVRPPVWSPRSRRSPA
jgi:Ca2+-transporting ATPase